MQTTHSSLSGVEMCGIRYIQVEMSTSSPLSQLRVFYKITLFSRKYYIKKT